MLINHLERIKDMDKITNKTYIIVLKYVAFASIIIDIILKNTINGNEKFIMLLVTMLLIANDYYRIYKLKKHIKLTFYLSLAMTIIGAGFLYYRLDSLGINVYFIFPLVEVLLYSGKVPIPLFILHFITFSAINISQLKVISIYKVAYVVLNYLLISLIIYLYRGIKVEKDKVDKLNLELKDYSNKIEELTVSKERTRIAQELHDSLGHYLVALNMNLEFAEKAAQLKPEKSIEAIRKSRDISQECIINLRKAVNVLKENSSVQNLRKSLNEMLDNFQLAEKLNFKLEMDEEIELLNPDIKNCIYKTVQESITNGIKHGKSSEFKIWILKNVDNIELIIKDNGIGCNKIIKSNGINGIEKRITALGGQINFSSVDNCGFTIEANIPENFIPMEKEYI